MDYKEIVLSNIIGLNPTGTLEFNGTYNMNGHDNIVKNTSDISKENLVKAQNNKIVCNHVEKFGNFNDNNNSNNLNNIENMFLIILIIILLFILFLI
jgi:hypothetical protein